MLREPATTPVALIVDSPHSGMEWPADFTPAAPRDAILTTWDAYVDELFGEAPSVGATLLAAAFPRAYVDVNRAEDDIDPDLLDAPWPGPISPSGYTSRGMGLIRRLALPNVPMYSRRLRVAEVEHRLQAYYRPYRLALGDRIETLSRRFSSVWHLNCHSMKSCGNEMNVDAGEMRPDFVVSDRQGATADPSYTAWVAEWFRSRGYSVQINDPYQGGDLIKHFGAPVRGHHSIQVEINRALYLNETSATRAPRFDDLKAACTDFLHAFAARIPT